MKNINKYILGLVMISFLFACEEPLGIDPQQSIDSAALITDASSANVAMNGLYSNAQDFWRDRAYFNIDVLSDITDHVGTFTSLREFTENDVLPSNVEFNQIWDPAYALIYNANVVLAVLPGVDDPALDAVRSQYLGEARALRAYAYYYLTNVFGDVPLILDPVNDLADVNIAATPQSDVYDQIVADLNIAAGELASGGATRLSKGAAYAMLAKVHLSRGHLAMADLAADEVIAEGYTLEPNYMDLYNGNISSEAIFQLEFNTADANSLSFWYWDKPAGRQEIAPSQMIVDAYEDGDARRASVADALDAAPNSPYYVAKWSDFATGTDKPIVLRLADILLIKAEAQADAGNFGPASDLVNQVRARAGLADVTLDASNYMDIILKERMIELAWEGGHRWFDMLRTNLAEDWVVSKGLDACKAIMPIPRSEVDANTAIMQNSCY
jgi:hypothetical protein